MNLLFSLFAASLTISAGKALDFSSPHHYEQRFAQAAEDFQIRWETFAQDRAFTPWTPNRSATSIAEEFERLHALRREIWFLEEGHSHPDYKTADELILYDRVRAPDCIPFEYNKACSYYNGSLIQVGARRFVALMAPREKDLFAFFHLLHDAPLAALVRLTPAQEGTLSKCYPYWEEREAEQNLQIPHPEKPLLTLPYFALEGWLDNRGISPETLLQFVQKVRSFWDSSRPLAVHCTNGVGRTGTFIAALLLLDEIDRQLQTGVASQDIKVSVEETVLRLSLQRFFMCGQISQYETLYRLLELYLDNNRSISRSRAEDIQE